MRSSRRGRPLRLWRGGEWRVARGWGSTVRERMPGLGLRWLSLVETPDLDLVPQRFAPERAAILRAGLELGVLHLGLWGLSKLVTVGGMPADAPWPCACSPSAQPSEVRPRVSCPARSSRSP